MFYAKTYSYVDEFLFLIYTRPNAYVYKRNYFIDNILMPPTIHFVTFSEEDFAMLNILHCTALGYVLYQEVILLY